MSIFIRTGNAGTDPDVELADLGITIATSATWTELLAGDDGDPDAGNGQFTARELRDSVDLHTAITGGSVEWSKDGSAIEVASSFIADVTLTEDLADDYIDLTIGRFTLPNSATLPTNGDEGELYWDNDDDELYVWDGTQWTLIAAASGIVTDHGGLSGLGDDDHTQYILGSGDKTRNAMTGAIDLSGGTDFVLPQANDVPTSFPSATEGSIAWDIDDDVLYAHDGTQWFALAPASGIITDHGGLSGLGDDDHAQYALLAGNKARNAITGEFDFTSGNLILPVSASAPASPDDGEIVFSGGVLYVYDNSRSKWLSVERTTYKGGRNRRRVSDIYLRLEDGIASSKTGYRMLNDGTIVGVFAQTSASDTWTFEVRRSGTSIASIAISAADGGQATNVNVDVTQGDEIQLYCNGSNVHHPIAGFEVAWRL